MSTKNVTDDGGPALPHGDPEAGWFHGMSLRDYYAGQALAQVAQTYAECDPKYSAKVAEICFAYADAMIAARNRRAASPSATPSGAGSPEPK